jgi:hypothetical protein
MDDPQEEREILATFLRGAASKLDEGDEVHALAELWFAEPWLRVIRDRLLGDLGAAVGTPEKNRRSDGECIVEAVERAQEVS